MRDKEYLAVIMVSGDVVVLNTMFFADEVRDPHETVDRLPEREELPKREMDAPSSSSGSSARPGIRPNTTTPTGNGYSSPSSRKRRSCTIAGPRIADHHPTDQASTSPVQQIHEHSVDGVFADGVEERTGIVCVLGPLPHGFESFEHGVLIVPVEIHGTSCETRIAHRGCYRGDRRPAAGYSSPTPAANAAADGACPLGNDVDHGCLVRRR
jgi:hypothetical protein